MEYQCAFLVVLYGKPLSKSTTLQCLLKTNVTLSGCKVVLWNNGPIKISDYDDVSYLFEKIGVDVELVETIENNSLAKIYNDFLKRCKALHYSILDDDSHVTEEYLFDALNLDLHKIGIPLLTSMTSNEVISPRTNKKLDSTDSLINVRAITSGLTIGKKALDDLTFFPAGVFDERFYLYGIDSAFFFTLNKKNLNDLLILIKGFKHSLSRLDEEMSDFKRKERTYDFLLFNWYYKPKLVFMILVVLRLVKYSIRSILRRKQTLDLSAIIEFAKTRRHYRSKI